MPTDSPTPAATPLAGPALRERLERAADGLVYTTESDEPFSFVAAPRPAGAAAGGGGGPPPAEEVLEALGAPDRSAPRERTLDQFFARHIEGVDPHDAASLALVPRYERLKAALAESLRGARAVRAGRVHVYFYVVGLDAEGNIAGLATRGLET